MIGEEEAQWASGMKCLSDVNFRAVHTNEICVRDSSGILLRRSKQKIEWIARRLRNAQIHNFLKIKHFYLELFYH